MDIEFSFFATVDRIDCKSKKVRLSPAYTYGENAKNEPLKKFIHLLDFDTTQTTGVKIKGLQLSGKIPYDGLVIGEKLDGEEGDGMLTFSDSSSSFSGSNQDALKEFALHLDFLAACITMSFPKLKFHVLGEMTTGDGQADKGKIVVKKILWMERT